MRRYSPARNAIEHLREQWGLGDTGQAQSVPDGEGPGPGMHPLPTLPAGERIPYARPLPALPDRPLYVPPNVWRAGSVNYAARQRTQLDSVPKGSPNDPVLVYPTWESRMVNMRDFLAVLRPFDDEGNVDVPGRLRLAPYTVPQGYVAFLKEFRFFIDPLPASITEANTWLTLLIDSAPVPDFFNLPLGGLMNAYQKTFVIAEEGRQLSLQIDFLGPAPDGTSINPATIFALFYGNLRMRTGMAPSREVGEPPPPRPAPPPVVESTQASPEPAGPRFVTRTSHAAR